MDRCVKQLFVDICKDRKTGGWCLVSMTHDSCPFSVSLCFLTSLGESQAHSGNTEARARVGKFYSGHEMVLYWARLILKSCEM